MERSRPKHRTHLGLAALMLLVAAAAFNWPVAATNARLAPPDPPAPAFVPTSVSAPRLFSVELKTDPEAHARGQNGDPRRIVAAVQVPPRTGAPLRIRYGLQIVRDDGQIVSERISPDPLSIRGPQDVFENIPDALSDGYYTLRFTVVGKAPGEEMAAEDQLYWQVKDGQIAVISDYMEFRRVSAVEAPHIIPPEAAP